MVPPPPQPGPAQSPQEVPRSLVGEVGCTLLGRVGNGCMQGEISPRSDRYGCLDIPEGLWGTWRVVPFPHPTLLAVSTFSSSWRFTFYLIAFIAGMAVIVDVSGDYWEVGVGSMARCWGEATEFGYLLKK